MKQIEESKYCEGYKLIAGIDEVGRGCIAGPIVVACVILPRDYVNDDIKDSKQIKSHKKRKAIAEEIKKNAIDYHIEYIDPKLVDKLNPKKSSIHGMELCIQKIRNKPDFVLIDFEQINTNGIDSLSLVKGDSQSISIAAASIIAKVERDEYMHNLSKKYPQYSFDKHVGYLTKQHIKEIDEHGPIIGVHRFSFKPIKK